MNYLSAAEIAEMWGVSGRTVRGYCAAGKIPGAYLQGKTWQIPESAMRPDRKNKKGDAPQTLCEVLKAEMKSQYKGGIYHKIQIELTYNSNHIEGSRLSEEQTRLIFETNTIGAENQSFNVDDIVETANHFRCIDLVIDAAGQQLSEAWIRRLHQTLKNGTSDSRKSWFRVGEYKQLPNEVGGKETTPPEEVPVAIRRLLTQYNRSKEQKSLQELLEFHYMFESIHPFQDGNGRIGRLILFKECLKNNIVPFIIDEELKLYYYRGLYEWRREPGYLTDTCLAAQDKFKIYLQYFRISYED